jgi:hypothetical protein
LRPRLLNLRAPILNCARRDGRPTVVPGRGSKPRGRFRKHVRLGRAALGPAGFAQDWWLRRRTTGSLNDLAEEVNPALRGWLNYFTAFYPSAVIPIGKRVDRHLMRWARRKYKRLERSEDRTRRWLKGVRQRHPICSRTGRCAVHDLTTERHEPDKPRGLRPDLWGTAGEIPAVYPALNHSVMSSGLHDAFMRIAHIG